MCSRFFLVTGYLAICSPASLLASRSSTPTTSVTRKVLAAFKRRRSNLPETDRGRNPGFDKGEGHPGPSGADEVVFDVIAERCTRQSLLSWSEGGGDTLIMHRLTGRGRARTVAGAGTLTNVVRTAVMLIAAQVFDDTQAWGRRAFGTQLVTQIEALWENGNVVTDPELVAQILQLRNWAVHHLTAATDLTRAIDIGRRVTTDCERLLGVHPVTAIARNNLAEVYRSVGRSDEAIGLYVRCWTTIGGIMSTMPRP